jgi:hypothetical protein
VIAEDGPTLNNFCQEKLKCINLHYNYVFLHRVVIKMIKGIFADVFNFEVSYKHFICLIAGIYSIYLFIGKKL